VIQSSYHSRLYINNTTISDNGYCHYAHGRPSPTTLYTIATFFSDFVSLKDVHFHGNTARHGGGLSLNTATSQLTNVYFANDTGVGGGGMDVGNGGVYTQRHVWTNLSFTNNIATSGGGINFSFGDYDTLIAHITNIHIANNIAVWGGGINFSNGTYFMQINNATIANNIGDFGGGIGLYDVGNTSNIQIRNSIISGNRDIYHGDSIKTINSIYYSSNPNSNSNHHCLSFSNTLVEGWKDTVGVILDTFPMFVDTANGNFHLLPNSPAVNVGNKLIYSPDSIADISWITVDLDSLPRICDGEIDLGCYEVPGNIIPYLFFSHSIRICEGDSVDVPLRLLGTPPWNIVYTTSKGKQYDTIKNITDNPYYFHIKPLETTIYRFISISDSLYNVPFSDSLTVFVLQKPVINMEDSVFLCNWDTVTINPSVTNSDRYQWNTGNTKKDISISQTGTYQLTASNEICSVMDSVIAILADFHNFQLLTTGDLCAEGIMELTTNKEDVEYLWSTGETSPTIQIHEDGIYKVSVSVGNCIAEDSLIIYCPCKVTMYNFFTPNGDGSNDIYLPEVESTLNDFSMSIYNRWGELVFQTETYTGWNGYINNVPATEGVYYAVVQYTCQNNPEAVLTNQSSVTLAR
jgi:gliding motility-associated-like protein